MTLAAFLVGLALAVAGIVFVVIRGIQLWRHGKRSGSAITSELTSFEERAARTERLLAEAEQSSQELQAAAERLRRSRAQLQVLLASLERAQRRTRWLRAFLPTR